MICLHRPKKLKRGLKIPEEREQLGSSLLLSPRLFHRHHPRKCPCLQPRWQRKITLTPISLTQMALTKLWRTARATICPLLRSHNPALPAAPLALQTTRSIFADLPANTAGNSNVRLLTPTPSQEHLG